MDEARKVNTLKMKDSHSGPCFDALVALFHLEG